MLHIKGLDHVVIRVADLEKMVAFYREVLGCSVEKRRDDLGLVHMRAGASLIDLISVAGELGRRGGAAPAAEGRNMDHLCLGVERFDEETIRRHLRSHGIDAGRLHVNFGAEGDGPSLYIGDPEGNVVELKGAPAQTRSGV